MKMTGMSCPSCDCTEVTSEWVDHVFKYGAAELHCKVAPRTCMSCGEQWLDYFSEDTMQRAIEVFLSMAVIDADWMLAAVGAALRSDCFNYLEVVKLLRAERVPVDGMDERCAQFREDWPCLFKSHMVDECIEAHKEGRSRPLQDFIEELKNE